MAAPLSQDLRRRVVQAVERGSSAREAARRFAVSESAAIKLVRRVRETGSPAPARIGGYRKPLLAEHEDLLRELTATEEQHHPGRNPGGIGGARHRSGLSYDDLVDTAPARAVA